MYYIVGLGNRGAEYKHTRHNAGRIALHYFLEKNGFGEPIASSKYAGSIREGNIGGKEVTVLYPETYMNHSGASVKKLVAGTEATRRLIVVYDEIDLPLGELKISFGRGSGGHNGLKSVIDALGTKDFARVRIGIAPTTLFGTMKRPKGNALTRYVLGTLKAREKKKIEAVGEKVSDVLIAIIAEGVEAAMNAFNR